MDGALLALHAGLDTVLRLQDGIIRRDQAMAAGVPESTLSSRVRRRTWLRVLPGVYAVDVDPATPTARIRATGLWAGDDSAITGAAAAWWWQLTDAPAEIIDVLVPQRRRMSTIQGICVIRSDVDEREIDRHRRLRLTTPAATCFRLARLGEPDLLEVALRTGTRPGDLDEALRLGRGRRGQFHARRSREDVRDNPWSHPERALHRLFREAGITGWTANARVSLDAGPRNPDVLFEELKLIVEVDGRRFHGTAAQHDRDHRRQNEFLDLGYLVLRFTPGQIADEPDAVVSLVRRAIDRLSAGQPWAEEYRRRGMVVSGEGWLPPLEA